MVRDYWREEKLRLAARLLEDAARNLNTTYPNSSSKPDPDTLPAVIAMIAAAEKCICAAQPSNEKGEEASMAGSEDYVGAGDGRGTRIAAPRDPRDVKRIEELEAAVLAAKVLLEPTTNATEDAWQILDEAYHRK